MARHYYEQALDDAFALLRLGMIYIQGNGHGVAKVEIGGLELCQKATEQEIAAVFRRMALLPVSSMHGETHLRIACLMIPLSQINQILALVN